MGDAVGLVDLETREHVRALLRAEGFVRVGFTGVQPVEDRVSGWVDAGRHATMDWMARDPARRADPAGLLEGARSVICVAAAYPAGDGAGPIAAYARGEDYHRTLRAALERGLDRAKSRLPTLRARLCVDTSPVLERALAARAGLGWIGKNTMLLDERHGPWLLLGEAIVDVAFPPDPPAVDRCGTCTACLDACPTRAFDGPRVLDARRCLSYWTIEHRGPVPDAWAAAAGARAFGCDDCLAACPFPAATAPAPPVPGPFVPRPDLVAPSLDSLEQRARTSFRRNFGSTPVERARKGGLLRNLAQARSNAAGTSVGGARDARRLQSPPPPGPPR